MKKLMVLGIVFMFVASIAHAEMAQVKVGKGDLKIGAILQSRFDYSLEEDSLVTNGQFTLNRARLLLSGTICPDRVKYFVQTEFVGAPAILDYKMILLDYIPKTSITIGRFLPNWTKYMPYHTGKLNMINYPLFLHGGYGVAVWRQVGLQTDTKIENNAGMWNFTVGIFNGSDCDGICANNWSDDNDAKDVLLRVDWKKEMASLLHIGGYAWLGNLLLSEDDDLATNMFGGFASFMHEQFEGTVEFISRTREMSGNIDDISSMGYYAHAEYKINELWGILGRYDFVDPNTDSESKKDAWTWITVGVNHYIDSWNAMIYLNFIHKMEQDDWGSSESIDNDLILLQFQVAP